MLKERAADAALSLTQDIHYFDYYSAQIIRN
jgi:hypothetical protein